MVSIPVSELRTLYLKEHKTQLELSQHFNCSRNTIQRALYKNGLRFARPKGRGPMTKLQMWLSTDPLNELHLSHISVKELAVLCGYSDRSQLYKALKKRKSLGE